MKDRVPPQYAVVMLSSVANWERFSFSSKFAISRTTQWEIDLCRLTASTGVNRPRCPMPIA